MRSSRWGVCLLGVLVYCCLLLPAGIHAEERQLSLTEAVRDALLNNLSLQLDKAKLVEAIGIHTAAQGVFDTTIQAGAGRGRNQLTPLINGGTDEETTTSWTAGLTRTFHPGTALSFSWDNTELESTPHSFLFDPIYSSAISLTLSQPLLRGFGEDNQTATIRATLKQQEARALVVESEAADLAAEVKNRYWDLVFAWQDIEVNKVSLSLAEKLLEETKDKIAAGKLADVELFRPESEVARRQESLISAERAIGLAEDRIKFLLNSDEWHVTIVPTDRPEEDLQVFDREAILARTQENRPDLRAAKLNHEAAEIALLAAKDSTKPSLTLYGTVGISGTDSSYGDSLDKLAGDSDTSWKVGLAYSRALDNSLAMGEMIQAEASVKQAKTAAQILELELRRAVRAALRDVTLAEKTMEATRKTSLSTRKGLEAEQIKFNAGRGTTLDVLIAQEGYASALSQEKLAKIDYAKTLAELDRLQGIITLPGN